MNQVYDQQQQKNVKEDDSSWTKTKNEATGMYPQYFGSKVIAWLHHEP